MRSVATKPVAGNRGFMGVLASFLARPGLPFADALSPERILRVFSKHDNLFGMNNVYSTTIVLWAFLAQVLRDGKEASCRAAVAQIAVYRLQEGLAPPTSDTGDYCRARAKLFEAALRELAIETAQQLQQQAEPAMVRKELWTTLLAYNLIRTTSATAAMIHGKQPRQISFTGTCQAVLSTWMLLSTGTCRDAALLCLGPRDGRFAVGQQRPIPVVF